MTPTSFQCNARAQFPFDSPNHLAVMAGMGLMLLTGVLVWTFQKYPSDTGWRKSAVGLIALVAGTGVAVLLRTYSRGGWVAFIAGLAVFACSLERWHRAPLFFACVFLGLCLLVPDALDRSSAIDARHDRSVLNRIEVWKGAMAMTARHWRRGVHPSCFGSEFTAWYQPAGMKTEYRTAINNYLTLSAEQGIFALWAYLALVCVVLWPSWRLAKCHQHVLILGVVCACVCWLVAGFFTYLLTVWEVAVWFWILWGVCVAYLVRRVCPEWRRNHFRPGMTMGGPAKVVARNNEAKSDNADGTVFSSKKDVGWGVVRRMILPPVAAATLICLLVLGWGAKLLAELPTRAEPFTFEAAGQKLPGVVVYPTKVEPSGVLVWNHGRGGSIREDGRDTLRYLAEKGFVVVSIDYREAEMDGLEDVRALIRWVMAEKHYAGQPVFIAGFSLGARLGLLAACAESNPQLKAVATIGCAAEWPFPELSPVDQLHGLRAPLLIIHGEADAVNTVADAQQLETLCLRLRKPHELVIVPKGAHHLGDDDQWPSALDRIAEFFKKHR